MDLLRAVTGGIAVGAGVVWQPWPATPSCPVHFSCHSAISRDLADQPQRASTDVLKETFGAADSSVKLIVLSGCYGDADAKALLTHVDCVVAMSDAL